MYDTTVCICSMFLYNKRSLHGHVNFVCNTRQALALSQDLRGEYMRVTMGIYLIRTDQPYIST